MAELEISKHAKQAYKHMTNKSIPFRHRIRELAIEIAIIVFAVSISIWFHGIGEHQHEQEQVKFFLVGLKKDLQTDIAWMDKNVAASQSAVDQYTYLTSLNPSSPVDNDKFDRAFDSIDNTLFEFMSHKGRYESFKSSGKLTNIEDEDLLQNITEYYEFVLPAIRQGEGYWDRSHLNLVAYLAGSGYSANREERLKLITSPKGKHLCDAMTYGPLGDYKATVALMTSIIKNIDLAYPNTVSSK